MADEQHIESSDAEASGGGGESASAEQQAGPSGGATVQSGADGIAAGDGPTHAGAADERPVAAPKPVLKPGATINQSDIDALLVDAGATQAEVPVEPPASQPRTASEQSATFDQSDIDALLNAAEADAHSGAGDSAPPPADARQDAYGNPFDEAAAAMAAAPEKGRPAAGAAQAAEPPESVTATSTFEMPELAGPPAAAAQAGKLDMLMDVSLPVKIELGRTHMLVEDVLKLGEGSVVELDKLAGDPVDVYVNDRLVARGEVLVLNDNFCVRVSEVLSRDPHRIGSA